jgi:DNA-binding response OmpR family regulator/HPt (histidine-containing phosphotransfer) domain-containing protein
LLKFQEANENGDRNAMTFHAHDLKNSAMIVGLIKLSKLCRTIEVASHEASLKEVGAQGAALAGVLDEALEALRKFEDPVPRGERDARTTYLAKVAHDIRGTVSRTLGFVTLMEDGIDSVQTTPDFEENVEGIRQEGQRMIDMADQALTQLVEAGNTSADKQPAETGKSAASRGNSVLLIEDDISLARTLTTYLNKQGLDVVSAASGVEMFREIEGRGFDCYVVDLTLPDEDGIVLIRKLRARTDAPIIVQTGREDIDDKLAAFELGADEYITKPVDPRELAVRIKSLLARTAEALGKPEDIIQVGDFTLDQTRHEAIGPDGVEIELTAYEFALIRVLALADGKILSRDLLVDAVSTDEGPESFRAVDTMVSKVRKKLGKDAIISVRGSGYRCGWTVTDPG